MSTLPAVIEQYDIADYDEVESENKAASEEAAHHEAKSRLRTLSERILRLEAEKRELSADISDIYKEAKDEGFDVPALRLLVKGMIEDETKPGVRETREAQLDLYRCSLGIE